MLGRNRFHPKNIYKTPPDFKKLAIEYPDFRKYVRQELSGRLTIDYQNQKAVKELTRTLLKKDFNLDVEIDDGRLIPRVPLCLNYILWLEDIMNVLQNVLQPETSIRGIDIGTGNVGVYSLLAAKRGWNMLATEMDPFNFKSAENNIIKNDLVNVISLKLVADSKQLLVGVINKNSNYDFCMCNPPFFDCSEKPLNRTLRRAQIKSIASNVQSEIYTDGGEVSFITQLMEESLQLREQIKVYTTLVGKKCDFLYLKKKLNEISPKSIAFTEFCQGKTTRWGMAWSFLDIPLNDLDNSVQKKKKKKKENSTLHLVMPVSESRTLDNVFQDIKNVLSNLEISYEEDSGDLNFALSFKACKNTWSHQRRKKRLEARIKRGDEDRTCTEENISSQDCDNGHCSSAKRLKMTSNDVPSNSNSSTFVEGFVVLKTENLSFIFEMSWLSGNKEHFHQIFQYFKNYWNDQV